MGGWVRRCRRWRKICLSLLAAYAVTTPRFPQAPQQSRLLSEIILSHPRSSRLHPQRCYHRLQMLGWPLMSDLPLGRAEGWHCSCLNSHSSRQGITQLSSGQASALASPADAAAGREGGGRFAAGMSPPSSCRRFHTPRHNLTYACLSLCCFLCSVWAGVAWGALWALQRGAGNPWHILAMVAVLTQLSRAELLPFEHRRAVLMPRPPPRRQLSLTRKFPRHRAGRKNSFHLIRFVYEPPS